MKVPLVGRGAMTERSDEWVEEAAPFCKEAGDDVCWHPGEDCSRYSR